MAWTPLYTEIDKRECIGFSMEKINTYFENIDNYIENLASLDLFGRYLITANNLSDVDDPSEARDNLGMGTAITKDRKMGAQAWVVFDRNGNILQQYNVSSVTQYYNGGQHLASIYNITYTTPLSYVGPIMVSGGRMALPPGPDLFCDAVVGLADPDYTGTEVSPPSVTGCSILTHDIDDKLHSGHYNEAGTFNHVNVVIF